MLNDTYHKYSDVWFVLVDQMVNPSVSFAALSLSKIQRKRKCNFPFRILSVILGLINRKNRRKNEMVWILGYTYLFLWSRRQRVHQSFSLFHVTLFCDRY